MPPSKQTQFRLSEAHLRTLKRLAKSMGIERTDVLRIAIERLDEEEKLRIAAKKERVVRELELDKPSS